MLWSKKPFSEESLLVAQTDSFLAAGIMFPLPDFLMLALRLQNPSCNEHF